jgi:hypothetical protein
MNLFKFPIVELGIGDFSLLAESAGVLKSISENSGIFLESGIKKSLSRERRHLTYVIRGGTMTSKVMIRVLQCLKTQGIPYNFGTDSLICQRGSLIIELCYAFREYHIPYGLVVVSMLTTRDVTFSVEIVICTLKAPAPPTFQTKDVIRSPVETKRMFTGH